MQNQYSGTPEGRCVSPAPPPLFVVRRATRMRKGRGGGPLCIAPSRAFLLGKWRRPAASAARKTCYARSHDRRRRHHRHRRLRRPHRLFRVCRLPWSGAGCLTRPARAPQRLSNRTLISERNGTDSSEAHRRQARWSISFAHCCAPERRTTSPRMSTQPCLAWRLPWSGRLSLPVRTCLSCMLWERRAISPVRPPHGRRQRPRSSPASPPTCTTRSPGCNPHESLQVGVRVRVRVRARFRAGVRMRYSPDPSTDPSPCPSSSPHHGAGPSAEAESHAEAVQTPGRVRAKVRVSG